MSGVISQRIQRFRKKLNLTQDEFGSRYGVSGPAIFKFEKGHASPKLALWLKMADDMQMDRREAVLVWVKGKLPEQYADAVAIHGAPIRRHLERTPSTFAGCDTDKELRDAIIADRSLPSGLIEFALSDDLWALCRPSRREVAILVETFSPLGEGSKTRFCEALRLIRHFLDASQA
jgi:DNA-binding XRE family transcriptional regulator